MSRLLHKPFAHTHPRDARPAAETALRNMAAVDKIVELEHLEASQQEIGEAIAVICRQNGMTAEQLKPYYNAEFEKAVIRSVMMTFRKHILQFN